MALSEDTMSKCSEHESAYESVCEDHPELKSFYASLQQRTIKAKESLTAGAETGLLSQHAIHMEVYKNLFEVRQDVKEFFLKSENMALKALVRSYFNNIMMTFEIFENVMDRVEKTEKGQLALLEAVAQFDKESAVEDVGGKKKRYENTLLELKKFKAMGDPFLGVVLTPKVRWGRIQQEQLLLLEGSLETVSELVPQLQGRISSLMINVNEAITDEEYMKPSLDSIREKVTKFTETIKELGETVADRSKLILEERFRFVEQVKEKIDEKINARINGSGK